MRIAALKHYPDFQCVLSYSKNRKANITLVWCGAALWALSWGWDCPWLPVKWAVCCALIYHPFCPQSYIFPWFGDTQNWSSSESWHVLESLSGEESWRFTPGSSDHSLCFFATQSIPAYSCSLIHACTMSQRLNIFSRLFQAQKICLKQAPHGHWENR